MGLLGLANISDVIKVRALPLISVMVAAIGRHSAHSYKEPCPDDLVPVVILGVTKWETHVCVVLARKTWNPVRIILIWACYDGPHVGTSHVVGMIGLVHITSIFSIVLPVLLATK